MRARAPTHTRVLPPDEVRGEGRSCCVGSGIYVYM
nr:MAG TPA: hypothetical protein [Caudoviricetes sp.]